MSQQILNFPIKKFLSELLVTVYMSEKFNEKCVRYL